MSTYTINTQNLEAEYSGTLMGAKVRACNMVKEEPVGGRVFANIYHEDELICTGEYSKSGFNGSVKCFGWK